MEKLNLNNYHNKRNFKKTAEPIGKIIKSRQKRFVVQHHIATKDHFDFRLEYNGVLLSFAVPKGPSYNPRDKRLAIQTENHPLAYQNFEGIIPKGEYGAGTVMLWDKGTYEEVEPFKKTFNKGYLKFKLKGKRLKGLWTIIKYKNNFLLIKENDGISLYDDINKFSTSIKSGKTMIEIANEKIKLTSPEKIMYKKDKITKKEIYDYYQKVISRMFPYIQNRLLTVVRCPNGSTKEKFYKKHFRENKYLAKKGNFYYVNNADGLLNEVQMNSLEFHIGGALVQDLNHPNMLVFDLDPDEKLSIEKVREGAKDLKKILDKLKLKSFLKTSGGKGYHIVVKTNNVTWSKFTKIAEDIANLMAQTYPQKYTTNIRLKNRKGKIFIDYLRNKKGASSVAPYSLRARKTPSVSMPIKWSELDKIKPDEITIKEALKRLKRKDPWEGFFD